MLQGKSAVVTGSTSGIGLAIAEGLAKAGANVLLNGSRDGDAVEDVRQNLADETGVKVIYQQADMTKPAEIEAMMQRAGDEFGGTDILINNAGIQFVSPIEDFPVEKWDQIMAINLSSAFHTTRLAVPGMKERKWGRILNIASAHSLVASPFKAAYVAAKHGILGMTKTAALEVAQHGVTVNAICPGYVLTPLVEKQIPATAEARGITEEEVIRDVLLAAQHTKQFVGLKELADLTVFLCGTGGQSITGTALPVDGGWTAA